MLMRLNRSSMKKGDRRRETGEREKQGAVRQFFYREEREGTRKKAKAFENKDFLNETGTEEGRKGKAKSGKTVFLPRRNAKEGKSI